MQLENLIKRGAEANLYLGNWHRFSAIIKVREVKKYVPQQLDVMIRRHRTITEASLMVKARQAGVSTPVVFQVEPSKGIIIMQFVPGDLLRDVIVSGKPMGEVYDFVGIEIAKLHRAGIIHGDLTTSNIIRLANGRIMFLDFGLSFQSEKLEDMAVDLTLLKGVLNSAHTNVGKAIYDAVINGYRSIVGESHAKKIINKEREITRRGRYARVV